MITNIELLINRYQKYMHVLNYSERTVNEYVRLLGHFTEYLTERSIQSIQNVTKADILDYQKHVYYQKTSKGHVLRPRSQNNFLRTVKCFYKFLYEEGYVSQNPARDVHYAKVGRRLPQNILSKAEVDRIFSVIDINTTLGYRDRTILEVLYSTGIRRDELGKLTLNDIDYE
ncbi:MAG: phage integrase N-terminal SAM-like domain-containing protein, partial [Candidatus Omnitrophica bacterium]|nr:phage integrase N-terminal SAM-like domain-containing protein [Candidatus Omnitrophota bacterium]